MSAQVFDLGARKTGQARVMAAIERMLAVRHAAAASFDELDQAIDEVRAAYEAFNRVVARPAAEFWPDEAIDLTDIPEVGPDWFARARVVLPKIS